MALSRFLVPVKDGKPDLPKTVKVVDVDLRGNVAEVVVDAKGAKYLRGRRYAREITLPRRHISVSQVNTYLRCPLQYFWRYEEGLKVPPTSALTFGSVTHKAIEHNYKHKVEAREDLPVDEVKEVWADEWDKRVSETQFEEGEKPGEIKDEGVRIAALYMKEVAPSVQPVIVEGEFDLPLENLDYTLKGIVDVVDEQSIIHDTKTSKRTPTEDSIYHDLQMTMYSLGHRTLLGIEESGLRMDYLIRTKTPKTVSLAAPPRQQKDIDRLLKLISYVARAIRDQLYYPNPHNFMCHPNSCGYWNICHERWR